MTISTLLWLVPTILAGKLLYAVGMSARLWQRHRLIGELAAGLLLASAPFLFVSEFSLITQLLLLGIEAGLLIVAARLVFGRLDPAFLRPSTKFNSLVAVVLLLIVLVGWITVNVWKIQPTGSQLLTVIMGLGCVVGVIFLYQVTWTLKHYRLRKINQDLKLRDLPTVSLLIPARNETHALTNCLMAAVASDYPKLEILVLDDCSQDTTPELIRAFAHDGVRFISGDVPAEGWLGRNQAMRTLAEQASGEYSIFADVDTHVSPQSITKLITYALSNNATMVSVLPQRRDGLHIATTCQQLRYFWQVALPITRRRVPVASQCWLIKADALHHLGGFGAVRQKIVPESSFARRLFGIDMYRFIIANSELGITTAKRWSSQNETAIRFLYPTFHRQPFYILCGFVGLVLFVLLPCVLAVVLAILQQFDALFWISVCPAALLFASYALVVARTHPKTWPLTLVCLPFSLLQESLLLILSMLLYEFGEVNWKGRNVCYPVIASSGLARSSRDLTQN